MNDHEFADRVATLLHEHVDARAGTGTDIPAFHEPGRPRRLAVWAPIAAAAAAVIALSVTITVTRGGDGGRTPRQSAAASTSLPATDPNYRQATARVEAAVAAIVLPRGAHKLPTAPREAPQGSLYFPQPTKSVRRTGVWAAPGTVSQVAAFVRKHPPAGVWFFQGVDSSATEVSGKMVSGAPMLVFYAPGDAATTMVYLTVTVAAYQGGVVMLSNAVAAWLPSGSTDAHYFATAQRVQAALSAVDLPNGSRSHTRSPVADLVGVPTLIPSMNLVEDTRYWTTPGSPDAAVAHLRAHPPKGFTTSATSRSGAVQNIVFDTRDANDAVLAAQQLTVSVAPSSDNAALRVTSAAIWRPSRPAATKVVDPTSVKVVTYSAATSARTKPKPPVVRTFGAQEARRLAGIVNGMLPVAPNAPWSCPARAYAHEVLVFDTSRGPITARVDVIGCTRVMINIPGVVQTLLDGRDIGATIQQLLNRPSK